MERKCNKILIFHSNCESIADKIKDNLIDNRFDIESNVVFKSCPQNDSQLLTSDEDLSCFQSLLIIGSSLPFLIEFNRKVRNNGSNGDLRLLFADISQSFVYLFTDFGPNVSHLSIEDYLRTLGDNISDKIDSKRNQSIGNCLLEAIISGVICAQLLDSRRQSNQLFCYEIEPKLTEYKFGTDRPIVVIGLGSLGFSVVKQLVKIGAKSLVLIDSDFVHKYNLRHNLFNESNIGHKKCKVVKEFVNSYDNDINIEVFNSRAQHMNFGFFEALSLKKGIIMSAVDNTETKRFLNKVSVNHSLPLIDIGINGHMFHIQPIVPHLTETYFKYSDPSDPEYPLCVVKSFPQCIEHCVEWSKTKFDNWFNKKIKRVDNWIQCLHISRLIFEKFFNQRPKQLLFSIPLDHRTETGEEFWADKQTPKPIGFDLSHDLHKDFHICCAKLLAIVNDIEIPKNTDICESLLSLNIPEFVPKRGKIIITDSSVKQSPNDSSQPLNQNNTLRPQRYSRDDGLHLQFIFASANCRALVYGIESATIEDIDKIHNNLIPCFASTLMTSSAMISIELLKCLQLNGYSEELEFKNSNIFYNLSDLSAIVASKPAKPLKTILSENCQFTEWDQWLINETERMSTLEEVLNELNERSGALCTVMVMDDTKSIYLPELFPHHLKRKKQTIRDIITNYYKTIPPFVMFNVSFESNSEDIFGPNVKYIFERK